MFGWIGWAIIFIGVWLIGKKNVAGFYCNIVAGVLINISAIRHEVWSLLVANTVLMVMNAINIYKWRKHGTEVHQGHSNPGERAAPSDHVQPEGSPL